MLITFQKISNTHHLLRCVRRGGSVEEAELETKTFAVHDFTHLAYEIEAGLRDSFWGKIAAGVRFADLRGAMDEQTFTPKGNEIVQTEMVVGPLQTFVQGKRNADELLAGLANMFSAYGMDVPHHLTEEVLLSVRKRFQAYWGEWQKLGYGEAMEIHWKEAMNDATLLREKNA